MSSSKGHYWPEREFTKSSSIPGYRAFWGKSNPYKTICGWQPFIKPRAGASMEEMAEHAKNHGGKDGAKVNQHVLPRAAVYEFALVHPDYPNLRKKVYVGKTTDLHRRHEEYLTYSKEGTRMWPFFEHALRNKCQVWRRFAYLNTISSVGKDTEGDRAVAQMETRWLSYFDYAFNREANPPKRFIHLEPQTFCCFIPAGIKVVRDTKFVDDSKDTFGDTYV